MGNGKPGGKFSGSGRIPSENFLDSFSDNPASNRRRYQQFVQDQQRAMELAMMRDELEQKAQSNIDARDAAREAADLAKSSPHQFWTAGQAFRGGYDPKSQFRWRVVIPGFNLEDNGSDGFGDGPRTGGDTEGFVWYAKTINKPTFAVKNMVEGRYPVDGVLATPKLTATSPELKPITMTLIDPVYPNATRKLLRFLRRSGFQDNSMKSAAAQAGGPTKSYLSVNKLGPESSFGEMYIEQISAYPGDEFEGGPDVLERWTLIDPYPIDVNFGDLNYSSDDLVEISVTWGYRTFKVFFPTIGEEPEAEYFKDIPAANSLGGGSAGGLPGT